MALLNPSTELHGFKLSDRTRWLLYAPMWMLFPEQLKRHLREFHTVLAEHSPFLADTEMTGTAAAMTARYQQPSPPMQQ